MIKIIKLVSGELIIGDITDIYGGSVKLSNPGIITTNENNQGSIQPFTLFYNSRDMVINNNNIVNINDPLESIKQQYEIAKNSGAL